jgi:hypothetical protein
MAWRNLILTILILLAGCATVSYVKVPPCNELHVGIEDGYGNICQGFNTAEMGMLYYYVPKGGK